MTNPEPNPATYVIRRVVDQLGGTSVLYWLHNPNPSLPGRWVPQSSRASQYRPGSDIRAALSEIPRDEATGARVVRLKPKAKPQPVPVTIPEVVSVPDLKEAPPASDTLADKTLLDIDRRIPLGTLRYFAFFGVRFQHSNTALGHLTSLDGWGSDPSKHLLTLEMMGMFRVQREPRLSSTHNQVWLKYCLTEEGRIYAERFRAMWDLLGMKQATDDGKIIPMPWPGLPEPYQPGTIAPTF